MRVRAVASGFTRRQRPFDQQVRARLSGRARAAPRRFRRALARTSATSESGVPGERLPGTLHPQLPSEGGVVMPDEPASAFARPAAPATEPPRPPTPLRPDVALPPRPEPCSPLAPPSAAVLAPPAPAR